ncbi:peptide-N-glycosidase F-related protein [Flavobacterium psychrotrophum]|uniref:peptide-N-glycosidase F-related protein n=1 Tax=Flavobacterium psychrotrophum TaxID=2294119 RepID=UPI000E321FC7|nr:peptide-N-glycosidase F-related protein [Flavobacterium psychrotrophum]
MRKTLLLLTLCASFFGLDAHSQEPYTLQVYEDAVFYGMYEGTVSTPVPEGAIRNNNTSYGKKLTAEQIAQIGNKLTINVSASALCDDYDRIGGVNLAFVPKGATSYEYRGVRRIEVGRFITPFMNNITRTPTSVPYTFDVDNLTYILHDEVLAAEYDFWLELEIYGYQGAPNANTGGAQWDFLASGLCNNRNDVYKGSLELVSSTDTSVPARGDLYFKDMAFKFELKNYVQATETNYFGQGTDELNTTVRSITFTLDKPIKDAEFSLITSNHGSNSGGEEYIRRWHYAYLDGVEKLRYRPGENCEPYRQYNTMPNGIYGPTILTAAQWAQFSNWCPGARIVTRVIPLGDLAAGEHTFKITVPAATFTGGQGYFPMSLYVQGNEAIAANVDGFAKNSFSVYPNPVTDIATIASTGEPVKSFSVVNTLGQVVLKGNGAAINMAQLQNGVYIVNAEFDGGQVLTQKIVKK